MNFKLTGFLSLLLLPLIVSAQNRTSTPEGTFRDATSQDFAAENISSKYFNELWTYHIQLENGMQVIYAFSINDFGSFKGRVTGAKLIIQWKDGKTYVVNKEYSPADFINEPDSNYIRLNPDKPYWAKGRFENEHRLSFDGNKDGIEYELNLSLYDIATGKVLGDGVYNFGSNELGLYLLIPHAKVKGSVSINGEKVEAIGTAYMDRMYQNNLSTEIMDRSYRIKYGDDENGLFLHFITINAAGSKTPIGYGVRYQNGMATMLTPSEIEQVKSTVKLDEEIVINPYQMDAFNVKVNKHYNTYSMLDELGRFKKFLAKQVIGGELIEMNGTINIDNTKPGYFYYMVTD
ncbi:hypothetical protein [Gracilimonas sp.]|uniref:hypothetical protein n=1 Tax=Gracilimonas sp. TaxID=1974203 RepID=UPI002870C368|nr:hypothetical protein [Gracilimonas sp.]